MKTSTSTIITFRGPFALAGADEALPAGAYSVDTEEELIEGAPNLAYRRLSTRLRQHARPGYGRPTPAMTVDPDELDAALARDQEIPERRKTPRASGRRQSITAQWTAPTAKD